MNIPLAVAAAVTSPLKGNTSANKKLLAEAAEWEQITAGKYAQYKNNVNSMLGIEDAISAAVLNNANDKLLAALEPEINKAIYNAYRGFQHEIDAWATGAAAAKAFYKRSK